MSWKSKKSFSERWETTRRVGKTKYVLCYTLAVALFVILGQGFTFIIHKNPISSLHLSDLFLGSGTILILGVLFSFLSWSANESQYKAIKEEETFRSIQDEQDRNDKLANAVFAYINYNNKIYQVTQMDSLNESLIGEKIDSKDIEGYDYYKIIHIDTDKAITLRDANNAFCKYEYLCDENFDWNGKSYIISCANGAMENASNDMDFCCHLGKVLGKTGNLELFENESDHLAMSLLVHPNGLVCETGTGKDGYFLAAEAVADSNTSAK